MALRCCGIGAGDCQIGFEPVAQCPARSKGTVCGSGLLSGDVEDLLPPPGGASTDGSFMSMPYPPRRVPARRPVFWLY